MDHWWKGSNFAALTQSQLRFLQLSTADKTQDKLLGGKTLEQIALSIEDHDNMCQA